TETRAVRRDNRCAYYLGALCAEDAEAPGSNLLSRSGRKSTEGVGFGQRAPGVPPATYLLGASAHPIPAPCLSSHGNCRGTRSNTGVCLHLSRRSSRNLRGLRRSLLKGRFLTDAAAAKSAGAGR